MLDIFNISSKIYNVMAIDFSSPQTIIAQVISIIATVICVLSFQIRSNKGFCLAQCCCNALFAISFFLLGTYAAAIMNTICIFRSVTYAFTKPMKWRIFSTIVFSILFAVAIVLSITVFGDVWYLAALTGSASIVSSIAICTDNNKVIRWCQICYVSPCWLFNNVWVISIGGIITEAFNWISSLIALIRFYRKPGSQNEKTSDSVE